MADDWRAGDMALCVSNGPDPADWMRDGGGPVVGSVHTVAKVLPTRRVWLAFAEWPKFDFLALGFRKIRPHEADEEDRETIRLLIGKPVKELT